MNKIYRLAYCSLVLGVFLALGIVLPAAPVAAQEPVTVRVAPANLTLAPGATADVAVEVVGVEGLYGFDVQLTFDPNIVEVMDANPDRPGVQVSLGRMLEPGMSVRDGADNTTGVIHYAMTQLNPSDAQSGTGNLIVVKLRGKAGGATDLVITSIDLARRDASAIASSTQPGTVTVNTSAGTQPTNTPIPTQAPPTAAPTGQPAAQAAAPQATATALPSATPTDAAPTATTPPLATTGTPTTAAETALLVDPTVVVAATDPTAAAPVGAGAVAQMEEVSPQEVKAAAPAQPDETSEVTPEPMDTPQAVSAVVAESDRAAQPASSSTETELAQDDSTADTLLTVGIGALLAAAVVAGILLVLLARRRATS